MVVIKGEGAVDRGIRLCGTNIATVEAAASEELADDLACAVHGRRAAAATIRGAVVVRAIDELTSRQCVACGSSSVDLMVGEHLRTEIRVADPVKIFAASERDGRAVPSEKRRTVRRILAELQQREVAILARPEDRGADGTRRRASRAVPVTGNGGIREEGLQVPRVPILADAMIGRQE